MLPCRRGVQLPQSGFRQLEEFHLITELPFHRRKETQAACLVPLWPSETVCALRGLCFTPNSRGSGWGALVNKGRKFSPLCILIDNIPKPKRKIELIQWHIEQEVHYFPKARFHLLRKRLNPWYDCFQSNVLFADHETWIRNPIHRNSNSNRIWLAMATDFDMTSLLCRLRLLSAWKGNPALSEKKKLAKSFSLELFYKKQRWIQRRFLAVSDCNTTINT